MYSNSVLPSQRTQHSTTPCTVLWFTIAATSQTSSSFSSMSGGSSRLLNGSGSLVCTTLCQHVPSGTSNLYAWQPTAFSTSYGCGNLQVKNVLLQALTCRLRLLTRTQLSIQNRAAFSMCMVLLSYLMCFSASWIWLGMVGIRSNHSSAAREESSYSWSSCIMRGLKPYKLG